MSLPMPDDANGVVEQGEDDTKVPKRVNPRQATGLVNEPANASTRRTTSKQPNFNPGISGSRAAATSQQQISSGPSRLTQGGPRRNTKEPIVPPVPSDRLYVYLKLYIYLLGIY